MSQLENRLSELEQAAAQAAPTERKTGWAPLHAALRLCYGDGGQYSPEELARLDSVTASMLLDQVRRVRDERPENEG